MAKITSKYQVTLPHDRESRLRLFDQATARHRNRTAKFPPEWPRKRGWTRLDLYTRGRAR